MFANRRRHGVVGDDAERTVQQAGCVEAQAIDQLLGPVCREDHLPGAPLPHEGADFALKLFEAEVAHALDVGIDGDDLAVPGGAEFGAKRLAIDHLAFEVMVISILHAQIDDVLPAQLCQAGQAVELAIAGAAAQQDNRKMLLERIGEERITLLEGRGRKIWTALGFGEGQDFNDIEVSDAAGNDRRIAPGQETPVMLGAGNARRDLVEAGGFLRGRRADRFEHIADELAQNGGIEKDGRGGLIGHERSFPVRSGVLDCGPRPGRTRDHWRISMWVWEWFSRGPTGPEHDIESLEYRANPPRRCIRPLTSRRGKCAARVNIPISTGKEKRLPEIRQALIEALGCRVRCRWRCVSRPWSFFDAHSWSKCRPGRRS